MERLIFLSILLFLLPLPSFAQQSSLLARKMMDMGFENIHDLDPSIAVDLMYARKDNFTGVILYEDLSEAYLHPSAAKAVCKAEKELERLHPGYRLKICDASRPMSVQRKMYKVVQNTPKAPYVSNPANGGGLHNYGLAVDITIVDENGHELDMGTKVDHLGPEANIDKEDLLVANGKMTRLARSNRQLLRRVMRQAGFRALRSEWWHFNLVSRAVAKSQYKRLDF